MLKILRSNTASIKIKEGSWEGITQKSSHKPGRIDYYPVPKISLETPNDGPKIHDSDDSYHKEGSDGSRIQINQDNRRRTNEYQRRDIEECRIYEDVFHRNRGLRGYHHDDVRKKGIGIIVIICIFLIKNWLSGSWDKSLDSTISIFETL